MRILPLVNFAYRGRDYPYPVLYHISDKDELVLPNTLRQYLCNVIHLCNVNHRVGLPVQPIRKHVRNKMPLLWPKLSHVPELICWVCEEHVGIRVLLALRHG